MDVEENCNHLPFNVQHHSIHKDTLENKLETFVMRFVKEFEAKLQIYGLILDGAIPKSGRHATAFAEIAGQGLGMILGGVAGFAVGLPGPGATAGRTVVGAITKGIGDKVGRNHHRCKVTNLAEFISYFEQNRRDFRRMLVEVGLDIFQSFEMQFDRVSSDLGEREAMNKLAIDAVDRAVDCISRTSAETQLDHHSLILEGLKFGQSKGEPVLNVPIPGRRKGFEITYKNHEAKEIKWKSGSLYSKVGIVIIINEHERSYYKSKFVKDKSCVKYGFRRSFSREKLDELESFCTPINLIGSDIQLLEYSYFYNSDILIQKKSDILIKLESESDQRLGIDRIKSLLKECKDEILEKLLLLKPFYNQTEILLSIETCLKNLKFEDHFSKLELKIEEQFESKTKAFWLQLEELKNKFQAIALTNETFQDSIWFDVRHELVNFTGREAILNEIEESLRTGPAVIVCGLGGIGKSELAVKYAHSRYEKSDNVIWVNAESAESITDSIWRLARMINVNTMDNFNREKNLDCVVSEIYKIIFQRKCLFILDNAKKFSDIQLFFKWFPDIQCFPKFIITTRQSSDWQSSRFLMQIIKLDVFHPSEAIKFVRKALSLKDDSFSPDIESLIEVLGNFPLALQLAITNIETTHSNYKKRNKQFTIKNFLEKFAKEPEKLLSCKLPLDMYGKPSSVFLIVSFTVKDLVLENELGGKARLILRMASYMAPDNIREEFFLDEFDDEDELIEVMNLLENYALVKFHDEKLIIHRLVQQAIVYNSKTVEEMILRKNLTLLTRRLTSWDNITLCTPHIISVWEYACNYDKLIEEFIINASNKFYIYTSFLLTLIQRNKLEIVKKIIYKIKHFANSNKISEILKKLFEGKMFRLLPNNFQFELIKLLKENDIEVFDILNLPVTSMSQPGDVTDCEEFYCADVSGSPCPSTLPIRSHIKDNHCTLL